MRRLVSVQIIAVVLLTAPAALAQDPPPQDPQPQDVQPAPAPKAPAKLSTRLNLVGHTGHPVVFAGKSFRVRGNLIPYVAGQKVSVNFTLNGRLLATKVVHVVAPSSGTAGKFVVNFHSKYAGHIVASVVHPSTAEQVYARQRVAAVDVIGRTVYPGQHGHTVRVMQQLLRANGYSVSSSGTYDTRTGFAVLAFNKMSGLARTTLATHTMLRRLINGGGRFEVRFPHQGRHAEGDLTHQVLALVNGDKVERIYAISSGKPSTPTVLGTFRIYARVPGYLPDGMYYSSFFIRGYAIHGYNPSPIYPASHGCMRTQIAQAIEIYNWLKMGDYVDTYYRSGHHRHPKPSPNAGP